MNSRQLRMVMIAAAVLVGTMVLVFVFSAYMSPEHILELTALQNLCT